jgi:hypothetical protein
MEFEEFLEEWKEKRNSRSISRKEEDVFILFKLVYEPLQEINEKLDELNDRIRTIEHSNPVS